MRLLSSDTSPSETISGVPHMLYSCVCGVLYDVNAVGIDHAEVVLHNQSFMRCAMVHCRLLKYWYCRC